VFAVQSAQDRFGHDSMSEREPANTPMRALSMSLLGTAERSHKAMKEAADWLRPLLTVGKKMILVQSSSSAVCFRNIDLDRGIASKNGHDPKHLQNRRERTPTMKLASMMLKTRPAVALNP
jgi:hypothetical protein